MTDELLDAASMNVVTVIVTVTQLEVVGVLDWASSRRGRRALIHQSPVNHLPHIATVKRTTNRSSLRTDRTVGTRVGAESPPARRLCAPRSQK